MSGYTVFDEQGNIVRSGGSAPRRFFATAPGERVMRGQFSDATHRVEIVDGRPVAVLLPPAAVTVENVKVEAQRRILELLPMWMVAREISGGKPISDTVRIAVEAIRKTSNVLEAMTPIPDDFTDDKWWKENG